MNIKSINDFDTFQDSRINKEEKNIRTNILDGQTKYNPIHLDRKLSVEKREIIDKSSNKRQTEDGFEIINPQADIDIENNVSNSKNKNERMKIYKD